MHDAALGQAAALGLRWGRADGIPVTREEVVAAARSWLGTPFKHQGTRKGVGVDCGGLVVGVSIELGLIPANYQRLLPANVRGYSRNPDGDLGRLLCDHYLTRIDPKDMRPGDIAVVCWDGPPRHAAIVADSPHGLTMIHADNERKHQVVEHTIRVLSSKAPKMPKLAFAYSLPGVV